MMNTVAAFWLITWRGRSEAALQLAIEEDGAPDCRKEAQARAGAVGETGSTIASQLMARRASVERRVLVPHEAGQVGLPTSPQWLGLLAVSPRGPTGLTHVAHSR
jgi:hypothetical protein